jgi:hypothetical protein
MGALTHSAKKPVNQATAKVKLGKVGKVGRHLVLVKTPKALALETLTELKKFKSGRIVFKYVDSSEFVRLVFEALMLMGVYQGMPMNRLQLFTLKSRAAKGALRTITNRWDKNKMREFEGDLFKMIHDDPFDLFQLMYATRVFHKI